MRDVATNEVSQHTIAVPNVAATTNSRRGEVLSSGGAQLGGRLPQVEGARALLDLARVVRLQAARLLVQEKCKPDYTNTP